MVMALKSVFDHCNVGCDGGYDGTCFPEQYSSTHSLVGWLVHIVLDYDDHDHHHWCVFHPWEIQGKLAFKPVASRHRQTMTPTESNLMNTIVRFLHRLSKTMTKV